LEVTDRGGGRNIFSVSRGWIAACKIYFAIQLHIPEKHSEKFRLKSSYKLQNSC
jgi:hypothetical protein